MYEQYVDFGRETRQYLAKYMHVARSVKALVWELYPDARVYLFGSVVEGKATAASDIDILIVSDRMTREDGTNLRVMVRRRIGLDVPVQLHTANMREFKGWYMRFLGKLVEV